jgi:hypothetical protein
LLVQIVDLLMHIHAYHQFCCKRVTKTIIDEQH